MKLRRKKEGITLIALVITIIVLLILAGVTINLLVGENGIIKQSILAKEKHIIAQYEEKIYLIALDIVSDRIVNPGEETLKESLVKAYRSDEQSYWVAEVVTSLENPDLAEDLIELFTVDNYRFLIRVIESENRIEIIESGKTNGEPYPTIEVEQLPYDGYPGEKVKIKVTGSVEVKGETKKVKEAQNVTTKEVKEYMPEGVIFEVEEAGLYTFKVTTNMGKSRAKTIKIEIGKAEGNIQITAVPITPRNTIKNQVQNGKETGPITVRITYGKVAIENADRYQYKIGREDWKIASQNQELAISENTTIIARYYDGKNGFEAVSYTMCNVDNVEPKIENGRMIREENKVTVKGDATDEASAGAAEGIAGVEKIYYSKDGVNYQEENIFTGNEAINQTYIKAVDKAGNEAIQVIDTTVEAYQITYDANGGTGAPVSQVKIQDEDIRLSTTKPTKNGYEFKGWKEVSTNIVYQLGDTYTANSSANLVAVWKEKEYAIQFSANGGTGAPATQYKKFGQSIRLSTQIPTRTGYTFLGWGYISTGAVAFQPGDLFKENKDEWLVAIWELKVTYNANGGTGAPATQTKKGGGSITLSTTVPTRTGYTFQGWSTTSTGAVEYAPGVTVNKNLNLFAVWKIITYKITFDSTTGKGGPREITKSHGINTTLPTTKPQYLNHILLGWSTNRRATTAEFQPGGTFTLDQDTTLYAIWKAAGYTGYRKIPLTGKYAMEVIYTGNGTPPAVKTYSYRCGSTYTTPSSNSLGYFTLEQWNENGPFGVRLVLETGDIVEIGNY